MPDPPMPPVPGPEEESLLDRVIEKTGDVIESAVDATEFVADVADTASNDCCCIVEELFGGLDAGCFIATAANDGDATAPQVTTLRHYRDQRLARNRFGRTFTLLYYRYGPYGARVLRRYPKLKPPVRTLLRPVAAYAAWRLK